MAAAASRPRRARTLDSPGAGRPHTHHARHRDDQRRLRPAATQPARRTARAALDNGVVHGSKGVERCVEEGQAHVGRDERRSSVPAQRQQEGQQRRCEDHPCQVAQLAGGPRVDQSALSTRSFSSSTPARRPLPGASEPIRSVGGKRCPYSPCDGHGVPALHPRRASVRLHDVPHDGKAQARAPVGRPCRSARTRAAGAPRGCLRPCPDRDLDAARRCTHEHGDRAPARRDALSSRLTSTWRTDQRRRVGQPDLQGHPGGLGPKLERLDLTSASAATSTVSIASVVRSRRDSSSSSSTSALMRSASPWMRRTKSRAVAGPPARRFRAPPPAPSPTTGACAARARRC